jgi:exodeoxyribonuclease VII small subunit
MTKQSNNMQQETQDSHKPSETSFEIAFSRLEQILELMNSGTVSLDESIILFEEADRLLTTCQKKLMDAERRVEVLVKNRNGDLVLGADQKPTSEKRA